MVLAMAVVATGAKFCGAFVQNHRVDPQWSRTQLRGVCPTARRCALD
jgi:hypothetical protein